MWKWLCMKHLHLNSAEEMLLGRCAALMHFPVMIVHFPLASATSLNYNIMVERPSHAITVSNIGKDRFRMPDVESGCH